MDAISLGKNSPKTFILAADGAFVTHLSDEDQIWALHLEQSETHPFHLETTYNLRARSMRLFPNLVLKSKRLSNFDDFSKAPIVTRYTPGCLRIEYEAKQMLNIRFECFFPEPTVIVGDIKLSNLTLNPIDATVELAAILVPMEKGIPSRPQKIGNNHIISGQSANLSPVLFMVGGPTAITNPYPALSLPVQLLPNQSQTIPWSLASQKTSEASFEAAKNVIASPWQEAFQKQIKYHASRTIHIQTGDQDWDAAFYLSQISAQSHFISRTTSADRQPVYIEARLPDYSHHHGENHNRFEALSFLSAMHLSEVILPAHLDTFTALVEDLIANIPNDEQDSSSQNAPKEKSIFQDPPLLSQLCLDLYEIQQDQEFLKRSFPQLCHHLDAWLLDRSTEPNEIRLRWENARQLQLESGQFNFDIWESTGHGLDIRTAESPALAAILYRELRAIQKIAAILKDNPGEKKYNKFERILRKLLPEFWENENIGFAYLDFQSHQKTCRELYYPLPAQSYLEIKKFFTHPQRLQIHLTIHEEPLRTCQIQIRGKGPDGSDFDETFLPEDIRWVAGRAHLTTRNLFSALESVTIEGLGQDDHILLETADFSQSDITCLTPIWSGGMRKAQISSLIEGVLNPQNPANRNGIPEVWQCQHPLPEDLSIQINVLWNTLVIKGLASEGCQVQAMQFFTNLMNLIIAGLKKFDGFFPFFDDKKGQPSGRKNVIEGLVPIRLFLQIAGIRLFSTSRVAIWGENPFPWPIDITWQGLTIHKEGITTLITFPNGANFQNDNPKPVLVTMEEESR